MWLDISSQLLLMEEFRLTEDAFTKKQQQVGKSSKEARRIPEGLKAKRSRRLLPKH